MKKAFYFVLLSFLLTGCGPMAALFATPTPTPTNTATPTHTPSPTLTFTPTFTATATFTSTPTATGTPTPTITKTPPPLDLSHSIAYYLIYPKNQEICDYNAIPIIIGPRTDDVAQNIRTALGYLLSIKALEFSSGRYTNPLANSQLTLDSVSGSATGAEIHMSGNLVKVDPCTDQQARDQVWATIRQFGPSEANTTVWVGPNYLDDIMIP